MDNLTHTLVGFVAGDAVARSTADVPGGLSASARRSYFVTVAAIGSNIYWISLVVKLRTLLGQQSALAA